MKYSKLKELGLRRNDVVWVSLGKRWVKDFLVGYVGPAKILKINLFQGLNKYQIQLKIPNQKFVYFADRRNLKDLKRI